MALTLSKNQSISLELERPDHRQPGPGLGSSESHRWLFQQAAVRWRQRLDRPRRLCIVLDGDFQPVDVVWFRH
jgi:hypothetical protein